MNPAELAQTLEALGVLAKIVDGLGIPGLVALMVSGPLVMLCSLYIIEYRRNQGMTAMVESIREENRRVLEIYRADTQAIARELGTNQSQTDEYYRDNVKLVKQYEQIAKGLQDVVVSNTTAITRLITMLEERGKHQ